MEKSRSEIFVCDTLYLSATSSLLTSNDPCSAIVTSRRSRWGREGGREWRRERRVEGEAIEEAERVINRQEVGMTAKKPGSILRAFLRYE